LAERGVIAFPVSASLSFETLCGDCSPSERRALAFHLAALRTEKLLTTLLGGA